MFYNVENLFDNLDDPETNDDEFLPRGERRWGKDRLTLKYKRIYQVIAAVGGQGFPAIIGLCEIENRYVLEKLLENTPLGNLGYKIVHHDSPDQRGIDVALLYRTSQFEPLWYQAIPVRSDADVDFKTRDILYVKGILHADTLHVLVNHWPSKYGGVVDTKPLRKLAAQKAKHITDSIASSNPKASILLMGDFNDGPTDESVEVHLGAQHPDRISNDHNLYNMAYPLAQQGKGSNKYREKWDLIDQIIVSRALLDPENSLHTSPDSFNVFEAPFLLIKDENYLGDRLFRTYNGFRYAGGFSDHLPVYIEIHSTQQ